MGGNLPYVLGGQSRAVLVDLVLCKRPLLTVLTFAFLVTTKDQAGYGKLVRKEISKLAI